MSTTEKTLADLVQHHLETNRDQIAQQTVASAVEQLQSSLKWKAEATVNEQLTKFYGEHVAPAIGAYLQENREAIVATICSCIAAQVETLATKLAEDLTKRLEDSYKRKAVLEALFGVGRGY